ncbi:MAG: hypothetical protein HYX40_10140 [Sphingobacteriales bacterium]|nr:hypothetical protein [Sphingobacteriales bacterium]
MKKLLILLVFITACRKEQLTEPEILNIEEFTKVENSSILLSLKPTAAFDYAELRMSSGQGPMGNEMYVVRASVGNKMELGGACLDLIEKLPIQETGFAEDCTPICFFNYVLTAKCGQVNVYNSIPKLKEFIGDVDSEGDAAVLALAYGYEFDFNKKEVAGIKKVKDGFEVLCKKRVKDCSPIQYNQFWLHISTEGYFIIKKEIIYSTLDACI